MRARVHIVAGDVLCGAGRGLDPFWHSMMRAQPLQARHDLGDARLAATYVAVPERGEPDGDFATAWLTSVCRNALDQARESISHFAQPRIALLVGSSLGGMTLFEAHHRTTWNATRAGDPGMPTTQAPAWQARYDGPTRAAAERLGLPVSAWTLNTACSSAANALGIARRWLSHGRIDVALVAGIDVISPFVYAGFASLRAIDEEPTSPFSAGRRGLNLGEAAVSLVLMRATDLAEPTSLVELAGFGSSCDAHHLTRPDPSGAGLARAMHAALANGNARADQVALLSAHATGTPFNDSMESAAFAQVFGNHAPAMHAAKPVAGHTLGAAGAVDAVLVWQALVRGVIPPTFRRLAPDETLALQPLAKPQPLASGSLALSTSSGFGGSNVALLFRGGVA
ncbi:MAG: beta-ketoacyl synthase N-terminal-like domain-containing protein [Myxococcota bacterium]